jgi:hypothetical protein
MMSSRRRELIAQVALHDFAMLTRSLSLPISTALEAEVKVWTAHLHSDGGSHDGARLILEEDATFREKLKSIMP